MRYTTTLLIVFLLCSLSAMGQEVNFSAFERPYVPLEAPTPFVEEPWDDPSGVAPLGFTCTFFGKSFESVYMDEFSLGGILQDKIINDASEEALLLMPMGDDIIDLGYDEDSRISTISYETVGPVGDRIFKMQWTDAGFYYEWEDDLPNRSKVSMQMWLYERDNAVEYHYGPSEINYPEIAFEFVGGPLIGIAEIIDFDEVLPLHLVTGVADSSVQVSSIPLDDLEDVAESPLQGFPPPNTVYRFEQAPASVATVASSEVVLAYPNPTAESLHVAKEVQSTSVYDLSAQLLIQSKARHIDMSDLSPGTYLAKFVLDDGTTTTAKLIKL